ncbi:YhcN/YlaJ family sporulation lipoprotein [Paenibacillus sp. NPDC056579]|uniref:YhcN/YlaJ family sporulation lipoprotein n=1 Tax=Paenibacillus sp. NPDC056579 TaxID=3345871 RepID=UPI0036CB7AA8
MSNHTSKMVVCTISAFLLAGSLTACTRNQAAQPAPNQSVRQQAASPTPAAIQDNRIQVARQAADKIVQLPGVKSANVLVTQNNAYVAAVLKDGTGQLTRDMEGQIAQQVKSTDGNVHNVYVSTNPDFVQRVNNYAADVAAGRPVSGFFAEFTEMVKRVFPNPR